MASLGHGAAVAELTKLIGLVPPQDAGTSVITSSAVDMAGYGVAEFEVFAGAITGTIDAKVQSSATSGGAYADITGAATSQWAATDDNHIKVICVVRPTNEFLKLVLTPTGGSTNLVSVNVHLYAASGLLPVTLDATVTQLVKVQVN